MKSLIYDGLRSMIGALGDPKRDKAASAYFERPQLTDTDLENAFEANWAARKVVTIPAQDALREWRTWHGDAREDIEQLEDQINLQPKTLEAQIKARVYGGAGLYFSIKGQSSEEPLDLETVRPDSLEYVTVFTRREITVDELELDPLSEFYSQPKMYAVHGGNSARAWIHPSRFVRLRGDTRADAWGGGLSQGWDQSVIVSVYEAIRQSASANANIASMLFEANIDVISVEGLMEQLNSPGGEKTLIDRFSLAAQNKSINGMLVLDSREEFTRKSATFSDLAPLMEGFALFCAAGADIPATRFLARSPSGMSATGTHDTRNYHDRLRAMQMLDIGPAFKNLDACIVRSAGAPVDTFYDWNPLERDDREELSKVGKTTAETLAIMAELGITGEELRQLTIHRMTEMGVFPHLETLAEETRGDLDLDMPEEEEDIGT